MPATHSPRKIIFPNHSAEFMSSESHTTQVKMLKDGITIVQTGDAKSGSGVQVVLAYEDILRSTYNAADGTTATFTVQMPHTSAKEACIWQSTPVPRGWKTSPVKAKADQLCERLSHGKVGNVVLRFQARKDLNRFVKEVATKLGSKLKEATAAEAAEAAAAEEGASARGGAIPFDPAGVVASKPNPVVPSAVASSAPPPSYLAAIATDNAGSDETSLVEMMTKTTLNNHEDIRSTLSDAAGLLGAAIDTFPGGDKLIAAVNLLAKLHDYKEAHKEVTEKIAEVQLWVLAQCQMLCMVAHKVKRNPIFEALLTKVGDKLIELHKFAAAQSPSDTHYLGNFRGYITVASFGQTCDEHMATITTLVQPAVAMAGLCA